MSDILVSINIISLGRDSIYLTLDSLYKQDFPFLFEINIILQGSLDFEKLHSLNTHSIPTYIYNYPLGLGFGYYRNEAIVKSNGTILVWIDDDEWTQDHKRLLTLTKSILDGSYKVVTGGYIIGLGKGYIADCISLLGYPGGGALGFEKMWFVDSRSQTNHICSGNFAFHKSILNVVGGFNTDLTYGSEDVAFGDQIVAHSIPILYNKGADVFHIHRSEILLFCAWHFLRGKAVYQFLNYHLLHPYHTISKKHSLKHIFYNPSLSFRYRIGVLLFFCLQYISQGLGYIYYAIFKK